MPKPALNNRNNRINVYGRVIAHDLFVNQGVSNNDSPTFASIFLTGDATIAGNLYVEGNTAILNSNVIEFEDNIIVINSKETGNGVTLNQAGFEIARGTLENYRFAFRESDSNFRIGLVSNMQAVATREDNPLLNGIMIWNNDEKRLDSSNTINIPIITFQSTINSSSSSTGSMILNGGIGIRRDIFTDGRIFMGGSSLNKRTSIFTNLTNNNLVLTSDEEINFQPRTNISIPTNSRFIFGDSNKFIRSNLSNNMDITCNGDINLNLGFSRRLIIPNLSPIVFSTDNEKIFTDGFNNMVMQCSQDILLQPSINKKILIPNDIPIAFSTTSHQIKTNLSNDLLITSGRNIVLTPNNFIRITSTVPSTSITSGAIVLSGGLGMSGSLNVGGDMSVLGDLNVLGTTTTINTETLLIKDNLVVLNNAPAGLVDSGILVKRFVSGSSGTINYAGLFYKESSDEYTFASTNSDSSILPLTITNYLPIRADSITLVSTSGSSIQTLGDVNIGKNLIIDGPVLKIPSGDVASRPTSPSQGTIRYNSEYSQFEGFGAGNAWGSLGGVADIAQTTKILASETPGVTDGNLYFYNVGTETMRINSAGNIGIGTTSPEAKLHVDGVVLLSESVTVGSLMISSTESNALIIQGDANINQNLIIDGPVLKIPSGDVASRPISPSQGTIRYNSEYSQFEGFGAGNAWGSLGGVADIAQTTKILASETPGVTDGNLYFYNIGTETMRINSVGNIGIGTTSPEAKLHVDGVVLLSESVTVGNLMISSTESNALIIQGDANINQNLIIDGPVLKIPSGDTASRPISPSQGTIRYNSEYSQFEGFGAGNAWGSLGGVADIAQTTKILASETPGVTDGNLYFYNVGTETMRINSAGNIGIGTTSPEAKLHVDGNIFATGEVTVLSDIRYKINIETITGALDKVEKLRGVYFNRKNANNDISSRNIGVIADEIEKVLPEVVYEKYSTKSVAYQNIIGLLIQAIKELKLEVNELKEIKSNKGRE
jgi:hypothetical protein